MDIQLAYRLSDAVKVVYHANPLGTGLIIARQLDPFVGDCFSGYVASTDETIILAFRGTAPFAMNDTLEGFITKLREWLTNFTFEQITVGGHRIHKGFHTELNSAYAQLATMLKDHGAESKRIIVTGHSAGGALATLAARRLYEEGIRVSAVYTYAAPRVGDKGFANSYPVPLYRFEYMDDVIPHVPFSPSVTNLLDKAAEAAKIYRVVDALFPSLKGFRLKNIEYHHTGRLFFIDWDKDLLHSTMGFSKEQPTLPGKPMYHHLLNIARFGRTLSNVCDCLDRGDPRFLIDHRIDGITTFMKSLLGR